MSSLTYVGKQATLPGEVSSRGVTATVIGSATPNQSSVQNEILALVSGASATYATKAYVDAQDATFALPGYYQAQDLLNLPLANLGVASQPTATPPLLGAATLDATTHVPASQMPVLGNGIIQGPYGPTATATGTTSNTPLKIADFNVGMINLAFQPLVYMQIFATGLMGKPIVEVRISNTTSAPAYSASTLVAVGEGRALYNDYHAIVVQPTGPVGSTYSTIGPNYQVWLSVWLYDALGQSVTLSSGGVVSGAAFFVRGQ